MSDENTITARFTPYQSWRVVKCDECGWERGIYADTRKPRPGEIVTCAFCEHDITRLVVDATATA